MGDYALQGLSPRSFEHLIQTLALKKFGDQLTIFGDGPDGGREATFDGPTGYGSGSQLWEGYGVVQAKFRARPESTSSDGEWFANQLKQELQRLAARRDVRKPEYYVIATNVTLSPVAERGWKDRAIAELQGYSVDNGLRGFDIWDYDKLRVMLDTAPEIRRAYAAFITPGDVLSDLQTWLNEARPDFYEIVTTFLQKEVTSDQFAKLEQAGYSADEQIPLSNVFVDLPIAGEPHLEPPEEDERERTRGFTEYLLGAARDRFVESSSEQTPLGFKDPRLDGDTGRFVLIGGPGQGKTTVGQYLCQLYRCALLQDVPGGRLSYEARQALNQIIGHCDDEGLDIPQVRRFPLRIVLSEFAARLASGSVTSLLSFITHLFNKRTDAGLDPLQVKRFLAGYPCLIVLDGLDEVPASSNRDDVLTAIRDFWVDLASGGIDAVVVATSRPQGYNDDFSPKLYQHLYLVPLRPQEALRYGKRLTKIRFGNDADRAKKVLDRLNRASTEDSTARLMRSPLQVTIMTLLVDRMGRPPQERWLLFNEYYKLIYQREIERDIPAAGVLRDHRVDIDKIHRRVALLLQSENERSGRTDAKLTTEQFALVVEERLREEGFEGPDLEHAKVQIIDGAATRLVFLVGVVEGLVGFEIRSLQEFMAAEGLMDGSDEITQRRLEAIAANTNWRNVFLFAAGKCFSERQYLRDTVVGVCGRLNETPDDDTLVQTLFGSQLALEIMEDGSARSQPAYLRQLGRIALRLLTLPPDPAHRRLAEVYQPSLRGVYEDELHRSLTAPSMVQRLGGFHALASLVELFPDDFQVLARATFDQDTLRNGDAFEATIAGGLGSSFVWDLAAQTLARHDLGTGSRAFDDRWGVAERHQKSSSGPPWFWNALAILRGLPGLHEDLHIDVGDIPSLEDFRGIRFDLRSLAAWQEWNPSLEGMPRGAAQWEAMRAVTAFNASPSRTSLSAALAAAVRVPRAPRNRMAWYAAWPLSSLLRSASSQGDISDFALRAENDGFGDIGDWLEAEERWLNAGLIEDDLRIDFKDTKAGEIRDRGFPFLAASSTGLAPSKVSKDVLRFLRLPWTDEAKRLFARAFALRFRSRGNIQCPAEDIDRLVVALISWRDWFALYRTIPLLPDERLSTEAVGALDEAAIADDLWTHGLTSEFVPLLDATFKDQPRSLGVLMLLGEAASQASEFNGLPVSYEGPYVIQARRALCAITLRLGGAVDPGTLRAVFERSSRAVGDFVQAAERGPVSAYEGALLSMLAAGVEGDWRTRSEILGAMREAIARRTSPLTKAGSWAALKLKPDPAALGLIPS